MGTEQRQHISLSNHAFETLQYDRLAFAPELTISGFINHIILNYYDKSPASIFLEISKLRQHMMETIQIQKYKELNPSDTALQNYVPDCSLTPTEISTIEYLLLDHTRQLLEKNVTYPKEVSLKIRLQNKLYQLSDPFTPEHFSEARYYPTRAAYFKAVLEDYATLTFCDREKIFFSHIINHIEHELAAKKIDRTIQHITYTTLAGDYRSFEVKLHSLTVSQQSGYLYLIGLSRPASTDQPYEMGVFRISRIRSIQSRGKSFGSGKNTAAEEKMIADAISERGSAFLISEAEHIEVQLTPAGFALYNSIFHLRPQTDLNQAKYDSSGNVTLSFLCTRTQAQYYFFRFGKEAEIIQPEDLRMEFQRRYEDAAEVYRDGK